MVSTFRHHKLLTHHNLLLIRIWFDVPISVERNIDEHISKLNEIFLFEGVQYFYKIEWYVNQHYFRLFEFVSAASWIAKEIRFFLSIDNKQRINYE